MDYMIKQQVLNLMEDINEYMHSNEMMSDEQEGLSELSEALNNFAVKFDLSHE